MLHFAGDQKFSMPARAIRRARAAALCTARSVGRGCCILLTLLGLMLAVDVLTLGLAPCTLGTDPTLVASRHVLAESLDSLVCEARMCGRKRRRRKRVDMLYHLPEEGYNCRTFTWIGHARTPAVFDTGAARSSTDRRYLRTLQVHPATAHCVVSTHPIAPLTRVPQSAIHVSGSLV